MRNRRRRRERPLRRLAATAATAIAAAAMVAVPMAASPAAVLVAQTPAPAGGSGAQPGAETGGATQATPTAPAPQRPVDPIDGFRSAHFGMAEAEVMAAIHQDFGIAASDVAHDSNATERTTALVITVNDLVPNGGPARVVYIFGHESHTLIQVNVIWGTPASPNFDPAAVAMAANLLQNYFLGRGYAPNTVAANVRLPDGTVLLFAGSDAQGRQVTLTLRSSAPTEAPAPAEGQAAPPPAPGPTFLRLSYIKDPGHPDVFRLPAGSF